MYLRDLTEEEKQALHRTPGYLEEFENMKAYGKERQRRMKAIEEIKPLDKIPYEKLREILNAEDFSIESIRQELTER